MLRCASACGPQLESVGSMGLGTLQSCIRLAAEAAIQGTLSWLQIVPVIFVPQECVKLHLETCVHSSVCSGGWKY